MHRSNRVLKFICLIAVAVLIATTAVACNKKDEFTVSFVADGLEIPSITAKAGSAITPPADPAKDGWTFAGWYDNAEFAGDPVTLPSVMPDRNVTYYAKFESLGSLRVRYEFNLPFVGHTGTVSPSYGDPGDSITVKDGNSFKADGYLFVGWSTEMHGLVSQFGSKQDGQYLAGDTLTFGDSDVTLYAQWAREVSAKKTATSGKLYFYLEYVGRGNGAVILVRDGKPNKLGFVSEREDTDDFYDFEFYFSEEDEFSEVGQVIGRIYNDDTYVFNDGFRGAFLYYDYVTKSNDVLVLTADGFGRATISELVQETVATRYYGRYELDDKYGDYKFTYMDPETNKDLVVGNQPMVSYFNIERGEVDEMPDFLGTFTMMGNESGSYLFYGNGKFNKEMRLDLNGYGGARLYRYNQSSVTSELVAEGKYYGTEEYADEYGEWCFEPTAGEKFNFILNVVRDVDGDVPVCIKYDASLEKTLESENGDGSMLYLNGYGTAEYVAGGATYFGYFTLSDAGDVVTYTPYYDNGDGTMSAGAQMYFDVKADNKFSVNGTGFIVTGGTLTAYTGGQRVVTIPEEATAIGDGVFKDVSLLSVTIHEGVTSIGARAFQNNYTLQRAIFMSSEPIDIDFSEANDPFRWPSKSFVIVVPEGSQEAYRAKWGDKYAIKGSVEVTLLPEFEIDENGVLTRYNVQPEDEDKTELNITIPANVTKIADGVFRGLEKLKSVDLNNVEEIGDGAFEFCSELVAVKFTNVRIIKDGAFAGCNKLALTGGDDNGVIELPAITEIGANAFTSCYELLHVKIGEDIESIGALAFAETNMKTANGPLFIELLGTVPPEMSEKIFNGNIATRIKVRDINVVKACYDEPTFKKYNRHLYVESGAEKGLYLDGTDTLEIDGRAILLSSYTMMYEIEGNRITFYEYDEETSQYYTAEGTYVDGVIEIYIGGKQYSFSPAKESETFESEDGKYTLVCNPMDLQPEKYADTGYRGYATVTFNGQEVSLLINGYNIKSISNFLDEDGKRYNFDIRIENKKLVYEKTLADVRFTVTASDGSSLTIHTTATHTYIYGTIKIKVGEDAQGDIMMPDNGDYGVYASSVNGNVYVYVRDYRGTKYTITVTVSGDTFTYTYST